MSVDILDGIKVISTGEKILAEDINTANEHIVRSAFKSSIAGENITKGNALYIKASDGKVYKADADAASIEASVVIGFALETVLSGALVDYQCKGVFESLSGLTHGAKYYLSATAGDISATPNSTRVVPVGVALSSNHLLLNESGRRTKSVIIQTHDVSTTGAQVIPHLLGQIPGKVKITAIVPGASPAPAVISWGAWDGASQGCILIQGTGGTVSSDATNIINLNGVGASVNQNAVALATWDATNLTLTWSKTNSPTGTAQLLVELEI